MSFSSNKFFGLTCTNIKTSLGFGNSISQLDLVLVQDLLDGDYPDAPVVGTPVFFEFGAFSFHGLLQKFGKTNSVNGNYFEASIIDPREILDGAQIITGDYNGSFPSTLFNVYNVYGYLENISFGYSQSNESGIPWGKVIEGLNALSSGSSVYGRPLKFKGYSYSLDISELPRPPGYYRLPRGSFSVLEMIDYICKDCGCDYFIQLIGLTIKLRVISRFFQPPLGTISLIANSSTFSGSVISSNCSLESVNEVTSAIVTGGAKTGFDISTQIFSYFGNDINNNPIIGYAGTIDDLGACEFANLNAADCSDIIGSTTYTCSSFEMRYALWGIESWCAFLAKFRTDISALIGTGIYGDNNVATPKFAPDIILDDATNLNQSLDETLADRRERLFDLVHKHAETFYGKEFVVILESVQASQDAETGVITTSYEPTNAGWLEFGAASLGVPTNRLDVLQDSDDRVLPYFYYEDVIGYDTSRIDFGESAIADSGEMWTQARVDGRILFSGSTPYIRVSISGALYENKDSEYGNTELAGKILSLNTAELEEINKNPFGGTLGHIGIHPEAVYPTAIGVPLKSNVEVYGPWIIAGPPGKVKIDQDSGLTPWDYGSSAIMDLAGSARVLNAVTNQQIAETGGVTVAGVPLYSLGDVMRTGGPNLTNMELNYNTNGVSTSYRWQTFTPKFGLFSRQNSERLRRISLNAVQQRREFRKALNRAIVANNIKNLAKKGAKFNKAFWEKKQSPHTVLMVQSTTSGSDTRTAGGTETLESSLNLLNTGNNFTDKAVMSLTGLVRGFSTNTSYTGKLSKYTSIGSFGGTNSPITNSTLNPFASGGDIEIMTWGDTYTYANAYRNTSTSSNTRAIALRGPIVITGYGYGIDGNKYPGGGASFTSNYLKRSDLWKTGILDTLWDEKRGVWTCHDIYSGVTASSISSGNTGLVNIGNDSSWQLTVYNQWATTIASGKKCLIGYVANENRLQFIAVDC